MRGRNGRARSPGAAGRRSEAACRAVGSRRACFAFTLIELMLVIVVVLLLTALLVSEIPALTAQVKLLMTRWDIAGLTSAIEEFKRVYGEYPHDTIWYNRLEERVAGYPCPPYRDPEYVNGQGDYSLWLALQGPDGAGWSPQAGADAAGPLGAGSGRVQFGPLPVKARASRVRATGRWRFEDPFGRPVLYYKARRHWSADITGRIGVTPYGTATPRYVYQVCQQAWSDDSYQRGAGEDTYGDFYFHRSHGDHLWLHWKVRLTQTKEWSGVDAVRRPYNGDSYLVWTAGRDRKFGYWSWSSEHEGYVVDPDPEDNKDGVTGECDDVTNFM